MPFYKGSVKPNIYNWAYVLLIGKMKVAIIGAGMSGLSAGLYLLEKGIDVDIYEMSSLVGGMAGSVEVDGIRYDTGPHAFAASDPKMNAYFDNMLGKENVVMFERNTNIKLKGKYYKYPLKPFNIMMTMDPWNFIKCVFNLLKKKIKHCFVGYKDRHAEDWLEERFGETLYELFFATFIKKTWGVHPSELSANFVKTRFREIQFRELILRGLLGLNKKDVVVKHKTVDTSLLLRYPKKGGFGTFPEKIAEKFVAQGGNLHLNSKIVGIKTEGKKIIELTLEGKEEKIHADHFISTMSIPGLARLLGDAISDEAKEAAKSLKYRSLIIGNFHLNKSKVFDSLHYFHFGKDIDFTRVTELKNWTKDAFPEDETAITVEVTCNVGDKTWKMSDEEILNKIVEELEKEQLLTRDEIKRQFTHKVKNTYPLHLVGFEEHVSKSLAAFDQIENLKYCGRQATFNPNNIHDCIPEAWEVCDKIIAQKGI